MSILYSPSELCPEQRLIIAAPDAAICVDAIAGSGKSTLLAHLALHHCMSGVPHYRVGMLAVSRTAAKHLSDILEALEQHHNVQLPRATTIAALCLQLLRDGSKLGYGVGGQDVYTEEDAKLQTAMTKAMERAATEWRDDYDIPPPTPANLKALYHAMAKIKGEERLDLRDSLLDDESDIELLAARARAPEIIVACLLAFERIREQEDFLTFPDVMLEVRHVFRTEPDACKRLAKFDVVGIDEGNDLSTAMLAAALHSQRSDARVVVVADRNQCVEAQRGAHPDVLDVEFHRLLPYARTLPLSASHRFGPQLARSLQHLLHNTSTSTQRFTAAANHKTTISVREASGAEELISLVLSVQNREPTWRLAILYRQRSEALAAEFALVAAGLRYVMIGHLPVAFDPTVMAVLGTIFVPTGLLDNAHANDRTALIMATAQFFFPAWNSESVTESKAMLSGLQGAPGLGAEFGKLTVENAERRSPNTPESTRRLGAICDLWGSQAQLSSEAPAAAMMNAAIDRLQLKTILKADNLDRESQTEKLAIVDGLLAWVTEHHLSIQALFDMYIAARRSTTTGTAAANRAGTICISTFLRGKGKEFDAVIVGDVSADRVPQVADRLNPLETSSDHFVVERNLFYVAVTRVKHLLVLLHRAGVPPSPFVNAMRNRKTDATTLTPHASAGQPSQARPLPAAVPALAHNNDSPGRKAFSELVAKLKGQTT
jgi:DNA helicase-2/ATP-dependent DNA helicase PcrA